MKKILILLISAITIYGKAQINLGMGQISPNAIGYDTVLAGSTNSYSVWVKNYGSSAFNDSLIINTAVIDTTNTYHIVGLDSVGVISINANDSAQFSLTTTYTISANGYKYGGDVIVIWPVALSANTVDSLQFNIFIDSTANEVKEIDVEKIIKLYPNPAKEDINIENIDDAHIEGINIYDLNGKLVLSNRHEKTINIENLSKGVYNINVLLSNKKQYSIKIIKQ